MSGDLLVRTRPLILGIVTLFACVTTANAAVWEVLFSGTQDNIEAKVELKTSSLRERLTRGEKIVTAHLRHFYREGRQQTLATGDYEIHCAARIAYRSNLTMDVTAADRSKTSVSTSKRELLSGKAHSDLVGLMDILCNR